MKNLGKIINIIEREWDINIDREYLADIYYNEVEQGRNKAISTLKRILERDKELSKYYYDTFLEALKKRESLVLSSREVDTYDLEVESYESLLQIGTDKNSINSFTVKLLAFEYNVPLVVCNHKYKQHIIDFYGLVEADVFTLSEVGNIVSNVVLVEDIPEDLLPESKVCIGTIE
ncbi:hypothetical protein F422_gp050 [Staphylococcus phage SA11]|uniref:Uncharacterized protein n=1 Tax=Staphylococcus phage SA11 TaxID=2927988 RepID=I7CMT0_9CAUD|nr:hypothetical protein F422_gp050 [Staphylococcus phage SA11]APC43007.1 hypothetical protein SAP1_142 [Staphylococcus phage StAP1]UVT34863.1 hypothetical protein [Staphylococcus phage vB_SauM-V1SA20]WCO82369.1 hypothetical protein PBSA08_014 [Staphylococcus phage PBSA08]WJZ48707.1 hypothetical protein SAC_76 [Staphylococcus phage SAC]AFO70637.1 hypothetical protein [Staphylococcus phage SA11]